MPSSSWHITSAQSVSVIEGRKEGMNKTKNDFNVCLGLALSNLWVSAAVGQGVGNIFLTCYLSPSPQDGAWLVDQISKRSRVWPDLDIFEMKSNK